jgi:hypothetical protein
VTQALEQFCCSCHATEIPKTETNPDNSEKKYDFRESCTKHRETLTRRLKKSGNNVMFGVINDKLTRQQQRT